MRLKFSTAPPLPPLKAWTLLPINITTVRGLKAHLYLQLCASLSSKELREVEADTIALELEGEEGFELLNETALEVLNPRVDVVVVRMRMKGEKKDLQQKGKRKAIEVESSIVEGEHAVYYLELPLLSV